MSEYFPLPGDEISVDLNDEDRRIVIASSYVSDEPEVDVMVVLLNKQSPYYTVSCGVIENDRFVNHVSHDFRNIVPAAEFYQQESGCY